MLTASGNCFWNMSDARETANCSFPSIAHISEKISKMLLVLANKEGEPKPPHRALGHI